MRIDSCTFEPTVVISLELELCWGSFDHAYGEPLLALARWTREEGVARVLSHLEKNELSATWAIVGAIMHSQLPDVSDLPEVQYRHFPKPWFHYVPATNGFEHPEWFGPDLVERIRRAEPAQEIGFHSFSHVIFGDPGTSRTRAQKEFQRCAAMAREFGIPPTSFVFPRNSVGYLDELRQAGFSCFRDVDALPITTNHPRLRSLQMMLADCLAMRPRLVAPTTKSGMVAIPSSMMLRHAGGWRKLLPDSWRLARLRKGLREVQKQGGIFHVWFHPENLYPERPRIENVFAEFTAELGRLVKNGAVRCLTMGEVAKEYMARQSSENWKSDSRNDRPRTMKPETLHQPSVS